MGHEMCGVCNATPCECLRPGRHNVGYVVAPVRNDAPWDSVRKVDGKKVSILGYCPKCDAPGVLREKRPNGNDRCSGGHTYPSKDALSAPGTATPAFMCKVYQDGCPKRDVCVAEGMCTDYRETIALAPGVDAAGEDIVDWLSIRASELEYEANTAIANGYQKIGDAKHVQVRRLREAATIIENLRHPKDAQQSPGETEVAPALSEQIIQLGRLKYMLSTGAAVRPVLAELIDRMMIIAGAKP